MKFDFQISLCLRIFLKLQKRQIGAYTTQV